MNCILRNLTDGITGLIINKQRCHLEHREMICVVQWAFTSAESRQLCSPVHMRSPNIFRQDFILCTFVTSCVSDRQDSSLNYSVHASSEKCPQNILWIVYLDGGHLTIMIKFVVPNVHVGNLGVVVFWTSISSVVCFGLARTTLEFYHYSATCRIC